MTLRFIQAAFLAFVLLHPSAGVFAQSPGHEQLEPRIIEERLQQYHGSNPMRGATVRRLFRESGCEQLDERAVLKSEAPNVVCTLPGSDDGIIVVGAHFDRVATGDGVADNWSGASLLPSLYESLRQEKRRHTFVFVGFTDEEVGFVGSRAYLAGLTKDEAARIRAMVNLDTLGLGPTRIWVNDSDPKLVGILMSVASKMKLPAKVMNVDGMGDSDGRPFNDRNIPTITLHSATGATLGILHTAQDNISAINLEAYYDSYRLIAAYLAALDSALE